VHSLPTLLSNLK